MVRASHTITTRSLLSLCTIGETPWGTTSVKHAPNLALHCIVSASRGLYAEQELAAKIHRG